METLASNARKRAAASSAHALTCARDSKGKFAVAGDEPKPDTARNRATKKRLRNERDYIRRIVETFELDDVEEICAAVKRDAIGGGDVDPKTTNAAREWIGKYLLGNARVSLDDCERRPAIVKRR